MAPDDLVVGVPGPEVTAGGEVSGALVLLDLARPAGDMDALRLALAARTAVVVGVAPELTPQVAELAPWVDVTLVEEPAFDRACVTVSSWVDAAGQLADQIRATPRAALVVAALLRQTPLLPIAEALAAEASAYSTLLGGPEHAAWLARRGPARPPRPDDTARVALHRDGDLLHVRMVRVVRRNAFDAGMRVALTEGLEVALLDPTLRLLLTGEGPVFSAGGDLDEFGSAADPATAWVVRVGDSPAHALARLGDRSEAHVHGPCAGAGVELPAFAGRVVADPDTTFRLPELAMGLLPGAGGTVSLPRRIGRWRAAWMALTGLPVDASQALRWGLVDAVE